MVDGLETTGMEDGSEMSLQIDFKQIVEFGEACIVVDSEFRLRYVSALAEHITGYPKADLLNRVLWDVFPDTVDSIFYQKYVYALQVQIEVTFEALSSNKNWYEVQCKPYQGGLLILFRDISARKRAEKELAEREAHLALALQELTFHFENTPLAVIEWDSNARVVRWSPQAEALFGWSAAEVMGRKIDEWHFFIEEDVPIATAVVNDLASGRSQRATVLKRSRDRNGNILHCRWYNSALLDEQSKLISLLTLVEDVTESVNAAQRQRNFLREMLFALTEGRLLLCDSRDDLPEPLPVQNNTIVLTPPTLRSLRHQVQEIADALEFDDERTGDMITAVGEAAMNAVVHAGTGEAQVYAAPEQKKIQVWITDQGRGISEEMLHRAMLERGFTTAGTLGHGFSMILKTVDKLYLATGTSGTTVVLEQNKTIPEPDWLISAGMKKWEEAGL